MHYTFKLLWLYVWACVGVWVSIRVVLFEKKHPRSPFPPVPIFIVIFRDKIDRLPISSKKIDYVRKIVQNTHRKWCFFRTTLPCLYAYVYSIHYFNKESFWLGFFSLLLLFIVVYGIRRILHVMFLVCCVSLYKINLLVSVCVCVCVREFVCSRFACSLLLLSIFNISTIKYYSIFVLLQHFLKKIRTVFNLPVFHFNPLYFVWVSVFTCVYFTCAKECVPFIISITLSPPSPMELIFRSGSSCCCCSSYVRLLKLCKCTQCCTRWK